MQFASALDAIVEGGIPAAAGRFGSALNAEWVDEALKETGTMSLRRRRLPARLVVWLVISMALFRDCAIQTVAVHLGLSNPWGSARRGSRARSVAASAVAQSRQRLGSAPMRLIFERSGQAWAEPAADADRWNGLTVWGVDGTTLRIPDTPDNDEVFGRPGTGRGQAGYPQVRLVALMALRSHVLRAASFGPYLGKGTGEHSLAKELRPTIPEDSVTIFDKGFLNYGEHWRLHHDADGAPTTRHFLIRAKKNLKWKTLVELGPGDQLVEVSMSPQARAQDPDLPSKMRLRVVSYQVKGWPRRRLLTSLLDPQRFPAREVAALYHERWEIERGYAEIKTTMLERKEALRSRKPEGVRQEIWGLLLAYNLVRLVILEAAQEADLPPTRISFKNSLHLVRTFCTVSAWHAPAGTMTTELQMLREMLSVLRLPERRPERRYERHVKIKMSGYKRNPGRTPPTARTHKERGRKVNGIGARPARSGRLARVAAVATVVLLAVVVRVVVSGSGTLAEGRAALEAGDELGGTVLLRESVSWYLPVVAPWREPAMQALWDLHAGQAADDRLSEAVRTLESLRAGIWSARSVLHVDEAWLQRADSALAPLLARWEARSAAEEGRSTPGEAADRERHFAAVLARNPRPSRLWGVVAVAEFALWVGATMRGLGREGRARWVGLAVGLAGLAAFLTGVALA